MKTDQTAWMRSLISLRCVHVIKYIFLNLARMFITSCELNILELVNGDVLFHSEDICTNITIRSITTISSPYRTD